MTPARPIFHSPGLLGVMSRRFWRSHRCSASGGAYETESKCGGNCVKSTSDAGGNVKVALGDFMQRGTKTESLPCVEA